MPMTYVTMPSSAPTAVISKPLPHQERTVISDLAAPTAKCAASEMMAEKITAGYPLKKKNGMMGTKAPTAVDNAPENAEVTGLLSASSVEFRRSAASARSICSGDL